MMEVRNPVYNKFGTIDCEIEHPKFGWIKFTASPNDNAKIHAAALAKNPAPYVAPPPIVIDLDAVDTETINSILVEDGSVVRALALLVLDELNSHAAKITAILDAADTATSLATFKTSMMAIADQPQRTRPQLVAALKARIRG
jgi:ActR/RegA family two-component response regulator